MSSADLRKFLVIGGGISGLSSAYYLSRALPRAASSPSLQKPIQVLESEGSFGGWIKTSRDEKTEALVEYGPRSLRPRGVSGLNTLDLIQMLNIEDQVLRVTTSHPAATSRFLYSSDALTKLPSSLLSLFTSSLGRHLLTAALKEPFVPRRAARLAADVRGEKEEADESVHAFFSRRFSARIADTLASALCHGIYAGDARQLSVRSCFSVLPEAEERGGSVLLGMLKSKPAAPRFPMDRAWLDTFKGSSMISFKQGLATLPAALVRSLSQQDSPAELLPNTRVERLQVTPSAIEVFAQSASKDATAFSASCVISALPPRPLARLLEKTSLAAPRLEEAKLELVDLLQSIPTVTVATVTLLFDSSVLQLPVAGFGYLVPPQQPSSVLGVIFDSCVFPEHQRRSVVKVTAMMGGHLFLQKFGHPDRVNVRDLEELALKDIVAHLGLPSDVRPLAVHSNLLHDCIPQPTVGHGERVRRAEALVQEAFQGRLHLVGAAFGGVSVNDCIYHSRAVVDRLVRV